MAIKLSYSKISTYIECPRKYFLSYICDLGTGSSPHMSNGSAIHKCCEDFVDWPEEKKTLEELEKYYFEILPEIDTDNLVHESIDGEVIVNPVFEQKAISAFKSFYEDYTENYYQEPSTGRYAGQGPDRGDEITPKIKLQEQWFNIKTKDGHEIRGLIDRVDDEENGEHIIDYKSGQSRVAYKALTDPLDIKALQLSIYALARYKETGKIPYKSSFFYLEPAKNRKKQEGQYRTAPKRSLEQLEKVESFVNDIGNEIENALEENNFPMGPSPNCFWCDFNKNCEILAADLLSERKNSMIVENEKPNVNLDMSDWD